MRGLFFMSDLAQFELRLARSDRDLRAAQRLRYRVFIEELGGTGPAVDDQQRLETDEFDKSCDHLLLIDPRRDAGKLEDVVGVYRLLPGTRLKVNGGSVEGFYSQSEYDLTPLLASGRKLLELGRSCVHPDYRGGTAMLHLWHGLADYVTSRRIEILRTVIGVVIVNLVVIPRHQPRKRGMRCLQVGIAFVERIAVAIFGER